MKMPFTPFHWGFSLIIQAVFLFLDPIALFIGSVIIDIEGVTALFIFPGLPLHGPLHSFTGAILLGFITGLCSRGFNNYISSKLLDFFEMKSFKFRYKMRVSLFSALIGTFSHIFLDAPLYYEMEPFYPFIEGNPFYGIVPSSTVYFLCVICFFVGIGILFLHRNSLLTDKTYS